MGNWLSRFQTVAVGLGLCGALLWLGLLGLNTILPRWINEAALTRQIVAGVRETTGLTLTVKSVSLRLTLLDGIRVRLMDDTLYTPAGGCLGKADRVDLHVRVLPLLFRQQQSIAKVVVTRARLFQGHDSDWRQIRLIRRPSRTVVFEDTRLILAPYDLLVTDGGTRYRLVGSHAGISHLESQKPLAFSLLGTLSRTVGRTPASEQTHVLSPLSISGKGRIQTGSDQTLTIKPMAMDIRLGRSHLGAVGTIRLSENGLPTWLDVYLTGHDMALRPLQPWWSEKVPYHRLLRHLDGRVGMKVRLKGPFKKLQTEGSVDITALSVTGGNQAGGAPLIKDLSGRLRLESPHRLVLSRWRGTLGGQPVAFQGKLDWQRQVVEGTLLAEAVPLGAFSSVASLLPEMPAPWAHMAISGTLDADVQVRGPFSAPMLAGAMTLREGQVQRRGTPLPDLTGLHALCRLNRHVVTLEQLSGQLAGGTFQAQGTFNTHSQAMAVSGNLRQAHLGRLQAWFRPLGGEKLKDIGSDGHGSLRFHLRGKPQAPQLDAHVDLAAGRIAYIPKQLLLEGLSGDLAVTSGAYQVSAVRGRLNGIAFEASGKADRRFKTYQASLEAGEASLQQIQALAMHLVPALEDDLSRLVIDRGWADIRLRFAHDLGLGGTILLRNAVGRLKPYQTPVQLVALTYDVQTGTLQTPPGSIRLGKFGFQLKGQATPKTYQVRVSSQKIPVAALRDDRVWLTSLTHLPLPPLFNTAGTFQVDTLLSPALQQAIVTLDNAGFSTPLLKFPVYHMDGKITLSLGQHLHAAAENLSLRYGNSPVRLSFDTTGPNDLYVEATGTMAPLLVNDLPVIRNRASYAVAAVPFDLNLSGKLGDWRHQGKGNNLNMFLNVNAASLFTDPTLASPNTPGDQSLQGATLSSVLHLLDDTLKLEQTRFATGDTSAVQLEGMLYHLFDPTRRQLQLQIATAPLLDLAGFDRQWGLPWTRGLAGRIQGKLAMDTTGDDLHLTGLLDLEHLQAPDLGLTDLVARVTLNGKDGVLEVPHVALTGVDAGFTARIDNVGQYPVPLSEFHLVGKSFWVTPYSEWVTQVLVGKLRHGFWEQFFPQTGRLAPLPFEIHNGSLRIAEGIVDNLIMEAFSSGFRMYSNGYFELPDAQAKSAGGTVAGFFAMNPRDNNFMTVHLEIDRMKANAVSRVLLNVSNQIFGDLMGIIDYTTEGQTNPEFLANTTGFADLRIENGRLPEIAKMENLLVAANAISGGLANLNLNSLFRLISPFKTDYFARLTGRFKMIEGTLYTETMRSEGENLKLDIEGAIRMVDGFGNLKVRGEMNREIRGGLGLLGKLSFGRIFNIFPPLGKLISHIPGVGFVPGFGGPRGLRGVAFEVTVNGPVIDPGSAQNFKWVK